MYLNNVPFWLVWNSDGFAPIRTYDTQARAEEEAKILAKNNPGKEFHVLLPVCKVEKADISIQRFLYFEESSF